jgi:8-oxo-dGTP pyrophosphatase MutT (NUDIX family)
MDQRAPDDMPDLTAGVIVFDNAMNVLLIKQKKNGIWSFPKGSVKYGETIYQGAIREALEETGLNFSLENFLTYYFDTCHKKKNYLYIYKLLLNYKDIPVRITEDITDFMWISWWGITQQLFKSYHINLLTTNYLYKSLKH